MKVAFIHPDLGIGGAERLVVDAAVGLQNLGHGVKIYTSHCDKTHCFEEVSDDTLDVAVYGDWLPTNVWHKFHILFAILRQLYLVLALICTGQIAQYDFFIVDQLSFCIPFLILFKSPKTRILFYCHFPDQLLSQPQGLLKKLYRLPFDAIEEWTTGLSDKIIVNSEFTKRIFYQTFTRLKRTRVDVIYPCVDLNQSLVETAEDSAADMEVAKFLGPHKFVISVNRFERKKGIELAISALEKTKSRMVQHSSKSTPKLVVAGGYDPRVAENVEYLQELTALCTTLGLEAQLVKGELTPVGETVDVIFMPSISSSIKKALIKKSELLLYTPRNEHFGIVPVESMLFGTPVLGPNNGGPVESIIDYNTDKTNATGFTVDLDADEWSAVLYDYLNTFGDDVKTKLSVNGFKTVLKKFSREQMTQSFFTALSECIDSDKGSIVAILSHVIHHWYIAVILLGIVLHRWFIKS